MKRSLAKTWFEEWAPKGRLYGIVLDGLWLHVGDPTARDEAEKIYTDLLASQKKRLINQGQIPLFLRQISCFICNI